MRLLVTFFLSVLSWYQVNGGEVPDHVFLLVGQSNMAGRAALEDGDDEEIEGALLWNGDSWEAAKPGFNRYSTHRKEKFVQGINPGVGFVAAYRAAHPDKTVGIVCWARGGTSIRSWSPDTKPMDLYDEALRQTQAALKEGGELVGILWHQGEADSKRSDKYPGQLMALVSSFREDLEAPKLPFVFSQLGQWKDEYTHFNEMIVQLPEEISHTACVTTEGLTSHDTTHFDRTSQLDLGGRFAEAILRLQGE